MGKLMSLGLEEMQTYAVLISNGRKDMNESSHHTWRVLVLFDPFQYINGFLYSTVDWIPYMVEGANGRLEKIQFTQKSFSRKQRQN